jgi:Microsomal signal peptidase 25 kDa subunit (SPC25)
MSELLAKNPLCSIDINKVFTSFLEYEVPKKYTASFKTQNWRLFILAVGCVLGLIAQFYFKFPEDNLYIALCAIGYFITSYGVWFYDLGILKGGVCELILNGNKRYMLFFRPPKGSNKVTIGLKSETGHLFQVQKSVGEFFYSDGVLEPTAVWKEIDSLVEQAKKEGKVKNK